MSTVKPPGRRKFSWALAFTLIALFLVALLGFIFWRVETWPGRSARQATAELERVAGKVRATFVDLAQLQPRVTINNRVYLEQSSALTELALVARTVQVEHEFEHTWAGSTKRVKLHGTYKVKAGFDLRQDVSVDVREREIVVQLPRALILGVEQEKVEVQALQNGLWNRISEADLQSELAQLPTLAREKAEASGLTSEAERSLQTQLEERLGANRPVRLLFHTSARKD